MSAIARFKWSLPGEWLSDKIREHAANPDEREAVAELCSIANSLASMLDSDQIQDLFQAEMDADGYFRPLETRRDSK